jgi:hypothetical protein
VTISSPYQLPTSSHIPIIESVTLISIFLSLFAHPQVEVGRAARDHRLSMGLAPQSEEKVKEREKNLSYFDSTLKLLRKANYSLFT